MADFNPVGTIEGFAVGQGINRLTGGLPFMPSFYDSRQTDPRLGLTNSEAAMMARGNGNAIRHYGLRQGGRAAGMALGSALGPLGALAGGMFGGWLGGRFADRFNTPQHQLTPSVNVSDVIPSDANGNPLTSAGQGAYNNFFSEGTPSNYGPYAGGYQGLSGDMPAGPLMPSFSDYSNQFTGTDNSINDSAPGGGYNYTGTGYAPSSFAGFNSLAGLDSGNPYAANYGGTGGDPSMGSRGLQGLDTTSFLAGGMPHYVAK